MKLLHILNLRKQEERQAWVALSRAQRSLVKESRRLREIQAQWQQAVALLARETALLVGFFRQYSCYLERLRSAIRDQEERVAKAEENVRAAREEWERRRVEREKVERLLQRRQEAERARENALEQANLDEIGRLLFLQRQQLG